MEDNEKELVGERRSDQDNNTNRSRRLELYEDDDEVPCVGCSLCDWSSTCPSGRRMSFKGCRYSIAFVLLCLLLLIYIGFILITPSLMLYIGITYDYCEDMFSTWLIIGGIVCYVDALLFLSWIFLRRKNKVDDMTYTVCDFSCLKCSLGIFIVVSVFLLIWWVFGFGRIFSGSVLEDPIMEDPVCRWYLYKFSFWLSLLPFFLLFGGLFGFIAYFMIKP